MITASQDVWLEVLTAGVSAATGASAADSVDQARIILEHLQWEFGGDEVYVPKLARKYPMASIRDARARGDSVRSICKRFRLDRRTLYRLIGEEARNPPRAAVAVARTGS